MLHPQVGTGLLSQPREHGGILWSLSLLCELLQVLIADEEVAWLDPSLTPSL